MMQRQRRVAIIAFFLLLIGIDWFLYFRHAGHFFQADTIFLLGHRSASMPDYFKEFTELNPSGWYRPLANELIESLLYPIAGLDPIPYRIPVYAVFIAITAGVYALALALTRRHLAAALAAFFFTIHTTNSYTTYDLGFMPELQYTLFYVGSTLAYFRYLKTASRIAYGVSLACFAGSLLSKEAAVTLPATLLLAHLFFGPAPQSFRLRVVGALRSAAPHMLIAVVYLAFAVGYLHIQSISLTKLFDRSQTPNFGDYVPVLNGGVFQNADLAFSWAFNIPRGWWGQWQRVGPAKLAYLKFFRALVMALIVIVLIKSQRKAVLFGFAWFWITMLPALPLVAHFIPYYLFLPVAGLSVVVGAAFVWLHDFLRRLQPVLAAASIVMVFGGVLYVTSGLIRANIRDNRLLGASSELASNTLTDLKRFHPTLPPQATLYFADATAQLAWEHDSGGLIKMAYGTDNISTLYQGSGDPLPPDIPNVLVFGVRDRHLIDETERYRFNAANFMTFVESDLNLELSPSEVIAGRDKYTLSIRGVQSPVRIAYTLNNGPLEIFTAVLDPDGKVTFDVLARTRKGVYRFLAFSITGTQKWVRAERTLTVR